jgi:hypothetical protein
MAFIDPAGRSAMRIAEVLWRNARKRWDDFCW